MCMKPAESLHSSILAAPNLLVPNVEWKEKSKQKMGVQTLNIPLGELWFVFEQPKS